MKLWIPGNLSAAGSKAAKVNKQKRRYEICKVCLYLLTLFLLCSKKRINICVFAAVALSEVGMVKLDKYCLRERL